MRLLVVGAGMYVTGRGTPDPGTILAALAQVQSRVPIERVVVCARQPSSAVDVARCADQLHRLLGVSLAVRYENVDDVLASPSLGERFDGCIVAVPDHVHHAIGMRVLGAGLHCLMVKPLAPTRREVAELIASQQQRGLYCAVELHKRWDESNLVVRRLLREGALGRLSHFTVEYSQRIRIPREVFAGWSSKTNIFQYLGVHYVDLVYFLTGFLPQRALAVGTRGVLSKQGIDTYDSVHAIVEWQSPTDPDERVVAQYATSWIDPDSSSAMSDQRYNVVGEKGRIECDQKNRGLVVTREGMGAEAANPYFARVVSTMDGYEFSGYGYRSIERFVLDLDDLRGGRVTPEALEGRRPTFRDALPSTAVVEAVNASLRDGSTWKDARVAP
jgi:predicted dehydrogenase